MRLLIRLLAALGGVVVQHLPMFQACIVDLPGNRIDALAAVRVVKAAWPDSSAPSHVAAATAGHPRVREVRGLGLMIGIECDSGATGQAACRRALERGVLVLPSGPGGAVISVTPPLSIETDVLYPALATLVDAIPR